MDEFSSKLYAFCLKFTKNPEQSEELVQDIFVKIWKNRHKIHHIQSLDAYLFMMAKNQCFDFLKKAATDKASQENFFKELDFSGDNTVENYLHQKEFESLIQNALNQLPDRQRQIFSMSRIEGKTHQEIATSLEISKNTVKEQITRASKRVKSYLLEHSDISLLIIIGFLNKF